jgi:hypothetical protein
LQVGKTRTTVSCSIIERRSLKITIVPPFLRPGSTKGRDNARRRGLFAEGAAVPAAMNVLDGVPAQRTADGAADPGPDVDPELADPE